MLPLTTENYLAVIDIFKNKFDSKYIAAHQIENILKINSLKRETWFNVSHFINIINSIINSLKAMNLPVNVSEIIAIQFLISELDAGAAKLWKERLHIMQFLIFRN